MRARNIKPGFFHNEQLAELPPEARLLFIGLWCMADREGRLEDRPKRIKMQVFPADGWDCESLLSGLHDQGLIVRYEIGGHRYIEIPTFEDHQRPHVREKESCIPSSSTTKAGNDGHKNRSRHNLGCAEPALNPDSLNPDSLNPDSKSGPQAAPADPIPNGHDEFEAHLKRLQTAYPRRNGSQRWPDARKAIRARLGEGHTWDEIFAGAERYARWVEATGKARTETVQQAATFVGRNKGFLEEWEPPRTKAENRTQGNLAAAAAAKERIFGTGGGS